MITHSKSTCRNDVLLEDDDDVSEGVFYPWLHSSTLRLRPEKRLPWEVFRERQATVSREGYELPYERSQEGEPVQRLICEISDERERSFEDVNKKAMPARKKRQRRRQRKTQKGGFVLPYLKAFARLVHKDRRLHKAKLRKYHKVSKRVLGAGM